MFIGKTLSQMAFSEPDPFTQRLKFVAGETVNLPQSIDTSILRDFIRSQDSNDRQVVAPNSIGRFEIDCELGQGGLSMVNQLLECRS